MAATYNFYMDDSGTRHPDRWLRVDGKPDWFALGGVLVRQSDEERCRGMHQDLCSKWGIGSPLHSERFDHLNASKYAPLPSTELAETLHGFKMKWKSSPMMQIADLYLHPICQGGYRAVHRPFNKLEAASRLIDAHVEDISTMGIKYYCFENIVKQKN
jgi:hypothetical protein